MGSTVSISELQLNFDRKSSPVYFPGETVTGSVILLQRQGRFKLSWISVETKGEIISDNDIREKFFSEFDKLAEPKRGKEKISYKIGEKSWNFAIKLPDHLPSSLNDNGDDECVIYSLNVIAKRFTQPKSYPQNRDIKCSRVFRVYREFELGPESLLPLSTERIQVTKRGFAPGEIIEIKTDLLTPIQCKLIQIYDVQYAFIEQTVILQQILWSRDSSMELKLPTGFLAPSYFCRLDDRNFRVSYRLEIKCAEQDKTEYFDLQIGSKSCMMPVASAPPPSYEAVARFGNKY